MKHKNKQDTARNSKVNGAPGTELQKKLGKPQTVFTDEQISQIEALAAFLSIDDIAYYLDVSPRTFYDIKNRDSRVEDAYRRGVAKARNLVASQLMGFIRDPENTPAKLTAIIFYLKTRAGWSTDVGKNDGDTRAIKLSDKMGKKSPNEIIDNALDFLGQGVITIGEAQQIANLAAIKLSILKTWGEDERDENGMTGDVVKDREKIMEQADKLNRVIDYVEMHKDTPEAKAIMNCLINGKKIDIDFVF